MNGGLKRKKSFYSVNPNDSSVNTDSSLAV